MHLSVEMKLSDFICGMGYILIGIKISCSFTPQSPPAAFGPISLGLAAWKLSTCEDENFLFSHSIPMAFCPMFASNIAFHRSARLAFIPPFLPLHLRHSAMNNGNWKMQSWAQPTEPHTKIAAKLAKPVFEWCIYQSLLLPLYSKVKSTFPDVEIAFIATYKERIWEPSVFTSIFQKHFLGNCDFNELL